MIDVDKFNEIAAKAHPRPWEFVASDASMLDLGTKEKVYECHVLSAYRCESCQKEKDVERFPCLWPNKAQADFLLYAVNNIEAAVAEIVALRQRIAKLEDLANEAMDKRF